MLSIHATSRIVRALLTVAGACAAVMSAAAELPDTLTRAATYVARPEQAVLLGIAAAGKRLVAVGERGLIVVSDDQAKTWRQIPVSLSVSLTAVTFATAKKGWVVGHRGVILGTSDGGETWAPQLDGRRFAERALKEAKEQAKADAEALVRDGADKPFLDVSFADERHGLAVGAYGLCARTGDGGASWSPCMAQLPNPKGAHLYAIARAGPTTYIAGEQGLLLRSDDAGVRFTAVDGPYTTSLFCVAIAGNGDAVLGGLRGSAFVSSKQARGFETLPSDSQGSCSGAARLTDGRLVFVNQLGQLLQYDSGSGRLKLVQTQPMAPLSGVLQTGAGTLVLVGARGITALPAPGPAASAVVKP